MSSVGLRDVAMMAVSFAYRANSMWCEGEGTSLTYRLERTGEKTDELESGLFLCRLLLVNLSCHWSE